jgi:hypothetical protein
MNIGIYSEEEKIIKDTFLQKFEEEVEVFNKLLKVYESFLQATSGKVKDNEYPNWTILILLSQTLPLMNNGLELLTTGYLRSSEIMIRVASEAMILSAYFKEFPETEVEYRTTNYRDFFRNHKIDDMLKKMEQEGKVFISNKEKAKQVQWSKIVFLNLFKESSRFLHNNPDLLYDLTVDNVGNAPEKGALIMGPQLYSDDSLSMGLRRLFNALLFSLVVLGVSLNISPDEKEKAVMDESGEITEKLNIKH